MRKNAWVSDIRIYCDILIETNEQIMKLVALNCFEKDGIEMEKLFINVSHNIIRLIPCSFYRKKGGKRKILMLDKSDGILDLKKRLFFLENDYDILFKKHRNMLSKIKTIRSKTEHVPHKLRQNSLGSGTSYSNIKFKYIGKKYEMKTVNIIELLKDLNKIFIKIIDELRKFRSNLAEEDYDHPYFKKYAEIDFNRYNKILESNLLYDISKVIQNINIWYT